MKSGVTFLEVKHDNLPKSFAISSRMPNFVA